MHRSIQAMGLVALAALTIACSGPSAAPPTGTPSSPSGSPGSPADGDQLVIVAKDLAFQPTTVAVPAGEALEVVLDNRDEAPHNIAIKDAAGATAFKGEIVGRGRVTNAIPALAAGSYAFWCEVHPDMQGTITAG